MGLLVALHPAEDDVADGDGVVRRALGGVADLQADHRVIHGGLGHEHGGNNGVLTGGRAQTVEVGAALPAAGSALHQSLTALAVLRVQGEAVVVLLALLNGHAIQGDVGLDAPHAALGGIVFDGDDGLAVREGSAGAGAVARLSGDTLVPGEISGIDGHLVLLAGDLVQLDLVDGDGEVLGRGILGVVRVGRDLAQVEEQLGAALALGREGQLQRGDFLADAHIEGAAEGLPALRVLVAGQDVGVGGLGGLGPDLELVVSRLQGVAGLGQLHRAVPVAGVLDLDDIGAVLQGGGGVRALADLGLPAVAVGHFHGGEVEGLVDHFLGGLLGDGQGGVILAGHAVLAGHSVDELILAGVFGRRLAVLEVQLRQGFDHDHAGQVAAVGIGGRDAGQGVKLCSGHHALVVHAVQDRVGGDHHGHGHEAHGKRQGKDHSHHALHEDVLLFVSSRYSGHRRPDRPSGRRVG